MNLSRRRMLVPEVVQTSAMDCGPASLKCLAEGFGIPVSYGRLREACQTDVDGTSIDTMEEVAVQLGLEAEQIMAPADFVLLAEANLLPAIAVVLRASKVTHFVVAWRGHGGLLQVMDPAIGRQWEPKAQFLASLYIHTLPVSAKGWREWAESEKFTLPLRRKLDDLGISRTAAERFIDSALSIPGWRALSRLEAGTRSLGAIVRSGGLRRGSEAERVLQRLLEHASRDPKEGFGVIPSNYWSAWAAPPEDGEERVFFKGAVLVHVKGRRSEAAVAETGKLPPEVAAALQEKPGRPARELLHMLKADGLLAPGVVVTALGLATLGVLVEAILFRSLLDMPREFGVSGERLGVMTALLVFLAALMLLELPIASGILRIGRHLEARLRTTFLEKIPKLGDRYFHSRLTSDMAERSHSTHRIRLLPGLGGQFLRSVFELVVTVAGIIWLDVSLAVPALLAASLAVALPLLVQPLLAERDLRVRNHTGALSRFYLDALLGLVPVRTHGAERALRREHESLLVEWARASFAVQRLVVWVEALQGLTGFGLAAWLMLSHVSRTGETGGSLLLVYWALNLPGLGEEIAQVARQYPTYRNVTLRLLEPIGALEDKPSASESLSRTSPASVASGLKSRDPAGAIAIELDKVSVSASGHTILEEINLKIEPGEHVAIVGASGAGKSSLLGLLLGWYRAAAGSVRVDGAALEGAYLEQLRKDTAWIDPAVQLWNRSLFFNLCYGNLDSVPTANLLEQAELRQLLEKLPDGLQTELGESGGLVSGGEGQRVRFGRALLRREVRLALLDEPFRGLDRHQRRKLLARARRHWDGATLLCVTHDVGETLGFPRALVVENGRIVEDGAPAELARQSNSRYRALLEAEQSIREGSWSSGHWRHLRLEDGRLVEELQRASV
ncbi:MAG: ABC transporter permease [Acidobacteria bacterium]|nr:MAG: ABC transporter permease [Acidobacteriota bacterium]